MQNSVMAQYSDFVSDLENAKLFNYCVSKKIGAGSFGQCFEIVNTKNNKKFAAKVLSYEYVGNPKKNHHVNNEINFLSSLKSPYIVEYIEHFFHQKGLFIITELCTNKSLGDLIDRRGYFTLQECRYFIHGILNGVCYLHDQNVIHRDLKPDNVLLDSVMNVKICDFGLAVRADDPSLKLKVPYGTPIYCAPEVSKRDGFTLASDIWSVGVILYVMLFEKYPFREYKEENPFQMINPHEHVKFPIDFGWNEKDLIMSIFQLDGIQRPTARECLSAVFFTKRLVMNSNDLLKGHLIGPKNAYRTNESTINDLNEFSSFGPNEQDHFTHAIEQFSEKFNSICGQLEVNQSLEDKPGLRPTYYVTKWAYNKEANGGLVFKFNDDTHGMLFADGLTLMLTPEYNDYWVQYSLEDMAKMIKPGTLQFACLHERMATFDEHQMQLINMATISPPSHHQFDYRPLRTPVVNGWFHVHASDAMITLLSNGHLQVFLPGPQHSSLLNINSEMFEMILSAKHAMAYFINETAIMKI